MGKKEIEITITPDLLSEVSNAMKHQYDLAERHGEPIKSESAVVASKIEYDNQVILFSWYPNKKV